MSRNKGISDGAKAGDRFGRLVLISKDTAKKQHWLFRCDCGSECVINYYHAVVTKKSQSCGCLARELKRERAKHRGASIIHRVEYQTWRGMQYRCHDLKSKSYSDYGGRGIYVCDRWRFGEGGKTGFECFLADMGKRPPDKSSIDRVDNDGPYSPDNCEWSNQTWQNRNQRSSREIVIHGKRMTLAAAAEINDLTRHALRNRIERGQTPEQAIAPRSGANLKRSLAAA